MSKDKITVTQYESHKLQRVICVIAPRNLTVSLNIRRVFCGKCVSGARYYTIVRYSDSVFTFWQFCTISNYLLLLIAERNNNRILEEIK